MDADTGGPNPGVQVTKEVTNSKKEGAHSPEGIGEEHGCTINVLMGFIADLRKLLKMPLIMKLLSLLGSLLFFWFEIGNLGLFQITTPDATYINFCCIMCFRVTIKVNRHAP